MPHDIVIRNGTLVDGTGAPGRPGDLALDGDRITAIGEVSERGRREINAEDKFVTPGFVDIHTHLDAQIAWDPHRLLLLLPRHHLRRDRQLRRHLRPVQAI